MRYGGNGGMFDPAPHGDGIEMLPDFFSLPYQVHALHLPQLFADHYRRGKDARTVLSKDFHESSVLDLGDYRRAHIDRIKPGVKRVS